MKQESPLRARRKALKLSMKAVGELVGVPHQTIEKLELGQRKFTREWAVRLAPALRCSPKDLLFPGSFVVALVGHAGAGSDQVFFTEGQGPFGEVPAPENATDKTVAVEIRGTSLGELLDGALIFYDEVREPPTKDLIGSLCIVGLPDGRVMVKKLRAGQLKGRFNLTSIEPPIYDAEVLWAARVKSVRPR